MKDRFTGFDFGLRNDDLQEKAGIIHVITRWPGST